ncbi:MAG: class I SAM-dependent methyltransferase [Actinomycetota bacterium]|nr:class I SAM-dependent methyltransferase [Actinomycetota bacterium]
MPAGDAENGVSAGVSSEGVDVAALFQRLQEEVRRAPGTAGDGVSNSSGALAARADADRLASVAVDVPIERRRGLRGRAVVAVKRVLRKLMSWYVGPFAADQRNFNYTVLRLIDELQTRLADLGNDVVRVEEGLEKLARLEQLERPIEERRAEERFLTELEERLLRLERRRDAGHGRADVQRSGGEDAVDYFAFEARMRGAVADIRQRQRPYVEHFRASAPVLDVGCGRGEFLKLLGEAGIEARGIEIDPDMVAFARGEGVDVVEADAVAYLERLEDASLGGMFAAHVLEHLEAPVLVRFLELAARTLRPGGVLVVETINPLSPLSLRHYFSDVTHAQPVVPETLALLVRQAGFGRPDVTYLNHPPPDERLRTVELPPRDDLEPARAALEHNVRLLNEHVFAALDYALVARTPS